MKRTHILLFVLILLLFSACTPVVSSSQGNSLPEKQVTEIVETSSPEPLEASATEPVIETQEVITEELPTATFEPTLAVTSTPDNRLPPEQWQEWPVVPEPTSRVREIYQRGIELGNDPHHFSKIGDCHSIREAFMGLFDKPGWYKLEGENAGLEDTIAWFSGSFDRDGQGVEGGFNAAAVLSPIWANPQFCLPGENPLQCEVRVHKPVFAFISLEVWWDGRTPERYEAYMRQIIEYLMDQGVVPILATKADNVEGDHALNYTTAKLAYEYNLPLWNFWRAVQPLPNHGMDVERNDGFHISYQAWNTRSFTALRTLDAMWKYVNE